MKRAIGVFLLAFLTFALIAYQLEWYDITFIERPPKENWDTQSQTTELTFPPDTSAVESEDSDPVSPESDDEFPLITAE